MKHVGHRLAYRTTRRSLIAHSLAATTLIVGRSTQASGRRDYPSRTIKFVVPLAAGGAADLVPRILAERLAARFGHPVVIENRPGAGHNIGAEAVAKSEPDGYTLLVTPPGPLVTAQLLNPKLPFEPSAFVPVSILATGQVVMIVSSRVAASNLGELIAYAKANPGKLTYASPGAGTSPHLAGEMLNALAGIRTTHVPYRGLAPAVTDLLAGHVDLMFDNLGNSLTHIREGRLRALGVASTERIPQLPDVPAIAETFPGFLSTSWLAMVAPPGTPASIAETMSEATSAVLRESAVISRLADLSTIPVGSTPSEAARFIAGEAVRWRDAVGATVRQTN